MRRLLLLLCACFLCMCGRLQPVAADPKVKSTLALGFAEKGPDFFDSSVNTGALGQLKLSVTGRDVGVFFDVRHGFHDAGFLDRKSRIKTGVDLFLNRTSTLFLEYQRSYHTGDTFGWAGIRFDLGRWFNQ